MTRIGWLSCASATCLLFAPPSLDGADTPRITKITVYPTQRTLSANSRQQLAVTAHFNNGATRDVTRLARYEGADPRVAGANAEGLVSTFKHFGDAWIVVRFRGKIALCRVTAAPKKLAPAFAFQPQTLVDKHTFAQWRKLGIQPSPLASDEVFLRRATMQLTGLTPAADDFRAFVKNADPQKRAKLIDRLLASSEHHTHFANIWADGLHLPRTSDRKKNQEAIAFYQWIHRSITADNSLDQFARGILEASGDARKNPESYWYAARQNPEHMAEEACRVFAGRNIRCFRCHRSPGGEERPQDYFGLVGFFKPIKLVHSNMRATKLTFFPPVSKLWQVSYQPLQLLATIRSQSQFVPRLPGGGPLRLGPRDDARRILADWFLDENELRFAHALVNYVWSYFFGRGIVHPPDEMRPDNPPSNPELFDALTRDFIRHDYSLKHLLQTICKSRTYQLGSKANAVSEWDDRYFSRFYPQPISADILHDVICQLTKSSPDIPRLPKNQTFLRRSTLFRAGEFASDLFAPPGQLLDEGMCEHAGKKQDRLAATLEHLQSPELQAKLQRQDGWPAQLAKDKRADRAKVEDVFLWTLARPPTAAQLQGALHFVDGQKDKAAAYQQLIGALARTREFLVLR